MSEPLTSPEIEDVLSSIRRLVSEDLRPARAAMAAARSEATVDPAEGDKLLLTPALRVVAAEPVAEAAVEVEFTDEPAAFVEAEVQAEQSAVENAPAIEATTQAFPADFGRFAAVDEEYDDAGMEEESSASADHMGGQGDILWAAAGEPVDEDVLAEPDAVRPHGHWAAQEVPGVDWAEEDNAWAEADVTPISFVAHPRKPDLVSDPLARAWADRAEADVRADLGVEPAAEAAPAVEVRVEDPVTAPHLAKEAADAGLFEGGEDAFDEEKLRQIVREIIREELAGTLGERITRNVRKLVRVEINRALTAREFE